MNVSVRGAELFYSSRGNGPACLVLSGIGTKPYEHQLSRLTDRLKLVFVDLRGSGDSTGEPADLTFDLLADDLEAIRLDLGVERVAVVGHSILGILAIEYGRRRPGSVSHVVVAGTPPIGDTALVAAKATAFFEENASEDRKQVLRDNLARLPAGASLKETLLAQTPARFFDARFDAAPLLAEAVRRPAFLMHVMTTLTPAWNVTSGSSPSGSPIPIAHGRHDYVVPHVLWDGVAPNLPGATLKLFERSGHQPFFEEPDLFAATLLEWMAGGR